jgi:lipopolysaccharide transport protein LptA
MAASHRNLAMVALLAACVTAAAQDREQLPIQLEARSQDLDFQKGVLKFEAITITQGQVRITAERAVANGLDFKESAWKFSGSVRISMPESTLASDTADVRFSGGEIASAIVTGAPATFEQQREGEKSEGRANRIDYDLKRGTVEFTGDAWLKDARTEVTSETLVYSTATQRVISDEPVLITIQPGERTPEKPKPES